MAKLYSDYHQQPTNQQARMAFWRSLKVPRSTLCALAVLIIYL